MFYVYRCTTDKLAESLTRIAEAGDTIVQPTWVGGRDWIIVCRKAPDEPEPTLADFINALAAGRDEFVRSGVYQGVRDGQGKS